MDSGKIVVVDDEKIVTSAFKTLFMVEGFDNAAFFNNPKEALEYIKNNTPDLIISDIVRDAKILELARNEAIDFVKEYNIEDFPLLKNVTSLEMFTGLDI